MVNSRWVLILTSWVQTPMTSRFFGHSPWECTSRNFHRVPGTFKGRTRAYKGRTRATIGRLWGDYGERHTFSPFIEVKQRNGPIYFNKRSTTATVLEKKKCVTPRHSVPRAVFGPKMVTPIFKTHEYPNFTEDPADRQPAVYGAKAGKITAACTYKKSLKAPR